MKLIIKQLPESGVSYGQLTDLIHEAFEERLQQGLNFTCSRMSAADFEDRMKDGVVFVALDEESGELLGTATVHVKTDRKGRKYGYLEYLAISPKAKHCGVGSELARSWKEYLRKEGAPYVKSDTACRAESSVKWHLKNGFQIYAVKAYASTDYLSYIFIMYLDEAAKKSPTSVRLHYLYSKLRYFLSFQKRRI